MSPVFRSVHLTQYTRLSPQTEPRFQFGRYFYIRIGLLYLSDPVLVHILDLAPQLLYTLPSVTLPLDLLNADSPKFTYTFERFHNTLGIDDL